MVELNGDADIVHIPDNHLRLAHLGHIVDFLLFTQSCSIKQPLQSFKEGRFAVSIITDNERKSIWIKFKAIFVPIITAEIPYCQFFQYHSS